jgi:hypothetical protein
VASVVRSVHPAARRVGGPRCPEAPAAGSPLFREARGCMTRIAYADPPYPGQSAKHYSEHPDFDGEVDHEHLLERLDGEFDAWALSTSSTALREVLALCPPGVRVLAWVKPFCAFKRNVSVAYAWEPIIVTPARRATPNRVEGIVMRDWLAEPITMKRGLTGAKPDRVCWWLFEVLGMEPTDEFHDLFPGSGAVTRAHESWKHQLAQTQMELEDAA